MATRDFTDEEVKDKLCVGPVGCGVLSPSPEDSFCTPSRRTCLGQKCMAWSYGTSRAGNTKEMERPGTRSDYNALAKGFPHLYLEFTPDTPAVDIPGRITQEEYDHGGGTWRGFNKVATGHCGFMDMNLPRAQR